MYWNLFVMANKENFRKYDFRKYVIPQIFCINYILYGAVDSTKGVRSHTDGCFEPQYRLQLLKSYTRNYTKIFGPKIHHDNPLTKSNKPTGSEFESEHKPVFLHFRQQDTFLKTKPTPS